MGKQWSTPSIDGATLPEATSELRTCGTLQPHKGPRRFAESDARVRSGTVTDALPHADQHSPLHRNARHVQATLASAGSAAEVRVLADSARTAADAAAALGVDVDQIVKSLVFAADGEPMLVLASGRHRTDTTRIAAALGATTVQRADADLVRRATGYPIGGVSPVGHPAPLRTLVDPTLGEYDVVWAAAGTPHAVFPTTYAELLRLTGGRPADIAEQ